MKEKIFEILKKRPLVFDGAMGTLLYMRGVYINRNFDELNLSAPEMVQKVHEDYLKAGAEILQTNTFGANRIKLTKFGFEGKVKEINKAGVKLTREVAGSNAFVAGSIGPTGIIPDIYHSSEIEKLSSVFKEQAEGLLEEGVDLIVLETFRYPAEIKIAFDAVCSLKSNVPVVGEMAFDEEGMVSEGIGAEKIANLLIEWGADIIGANCGQGPHIINEIINRIIPVAGNTPVVAQPNAGHPRVFEGRILYMATPEYFGEYTKRFLRKGVKLIGGCCGTTPDHIRAVSSQVKMFSGGKTEVREKIEIVEQKKITLREVVPLEKRSSFGEKLGKKFVISVEIDPPSGINIEKVIEGAKILKDGGIDALNIADGPRATARMSPIALATHIQNKVGIETIVHITCRDRNLLGILADLLGAHALGIRNLLIITGDPSKLGDYPTATSVYDLDSIGLLRVVSNLNRGIDPSGKTINEQTEYVLGCGVEPGSATFEREIIRLEKKKEAGAEFVMTQPVFDHQLLTKFLNRVKGLNLHIIVGILPLASFKNAEFLHNEVPGMQIPEEIRERMRKAGSGFPAQEEGIKIARETLAQIKKMDMISGVYIMPPFNRFEVALKVISC